MPPWLLASLHGYRIGWLPRDLIAGLMLAAIAIPGQLATARGAKNAEDMRNTVAKEMTPAQIAKAQTLAREWKPKPER